MTTWSAKISNLLNSSKKKKICLSSVLLILCAFFAPIGTGMNKLAGFDISKVFVVICFLLILHWLFFHGIDLTSFQRYTIILFGRELLTLLFKSDYAEYHGVFIRISIAGAVLFLFTFMNVGLQATRDFKLPVLIYSLATLTCGIFSLWLIPSYGMIGAVWALFSCYCVGFVGCSVSVVRAVKKKQSGIYCFKQKICCV